ncbi:putative metallophosphoesterase [Capsicum annuum]|uniref:Metallophosphoesterase n=1 Tax=Capsicum annuum TaxID=4072 RepID=A0A1U8EWM9_CAPAN|nr:LOW QUALITY PROTEIN: putative metallophosphoesterase At3g03305 [Capsicum annuum]KAF3622824.1 putative metallophosphoesterase [Capsicum annuum]PHT65054.1 putative metallophosphoesterase [Capsicum annuum]
MGIGNVLFFLLILLFPLHYSSAERQVIELKGGPDDVAWIVQLSDLHFSVHHPQRAIHFNDIVGPTLSTINPSLVFITGDLTDGKSKDLLTMKQDEEEWLEYQKVLDDVIKRSGLKKNVFYDLRGNHDTFGVPAIGGSFDFYSKYSINGQLKRSGLVNSVTIQTGERSIQFVGFDSVTSLGLRGPTNLFGHPTDQLLDEISSEFSVLDSQPAKPVIKIAYGHFPLSFSAASHSGRTLKDTFLVHNLSAYLCGHLHTRFGKNLKRHHESNQHPLCSKHLVQLNGHGSLPNYSKTCSDGATEFKEFWEWEMGDWRKSRAMRIVAIDRGWMSFVDVDFKLGAKNVIILPTFPLDSRYTLERSFHKCKMDSLYLDSIRALVFSSSPVVSVVARIYDSSSGNLVLVLDTPMQRSEDASSRGNLYTCLWNVKAFEDPSPERFLLQIEAVDIGGRSTLTELRPFSVGGIRARLSWNWKEFIVMGCQWEALYYPILWSFYLLTLPILVFPKAIFVYLRKQYTYKNLVGNKGLLTCVAWISSELYNLPLVWFSIISYLFYLILCPWLSGQVFSKGGERGYMTYRGWVLRFSEKEKVVYHGFPDIMVVVLPHLYFVVLPTIIVIGALVAEKAIFQDHLRALSAKKEDDYLVKYNVSAPTSGRNKTLTLLHRRWIRKMLLLISLAICWKHFLNCRALIKAYAMNPFIHFPIYSMSIPLLLVYTIYKTSRAE